jgi:NAD+ synthase (glutamine-hydrolysing)
MSASHKTPFFSPYAHGFVRVAVAVPEVRVADPVFNASRTIAMAEQASQNHAAVLLFPELGVSAYTNEDLFHQDALLEATLVALGNIVEASKTLTPVLLVGAPFRVDGRLFNGGFAIYKGRILAVAPKLYLPNYREFYEKRHFASANAAIRTEITLLGQTFPMGTDIIIEATNVPHFTLHTEICEDVWTPIPPSTYAAMAGATILTNLSASNITVGKADYRKGLCALQSGRCLSAYLYSAAGPGESTTDLAWDGHALIYENGEMLAESERFSPTEDLIFADIDVERLVQERMRQGSFADCATVHRAEMQGIRRVEFTFDVPTQETNLIRPLGRLPYVPADAAARDQRCFEAYNIQVHGLIKRMQATGLKKLVIGVSGGLDSTHTLIVAARAFDHLKIPRENILAFTLPGFATSDRTLKNAHALMAAIGATASEIDIKPSCLQMLKDIQHPFIDNQPVYDITFENVQAGERTSHLFRLANFHNAMVLGTGDLSELAQGWCTYGVGDHMSHYNVNASVPKTLIQHLIRWVIENHEKNGFTEAASQILQSIVDTEISPELIPSTDANANQPGQSTEAKIGPYNLQDFHLYYITRYGFRPSKVAYLAHCAWSDTYDLQTIKKWLEGFLWRFFKTSQFKRTCVPNSPKVGSGGSLSPRGDWRAPSDSEATVWLEELKNNVP